MCSCASPQPALSWGVAADGHDICAARRAGDRLPRCTAILDTSSWHRTLSSHKQALQAPSTRPLAPHTGSCSNAGKR